MERIANQTRNRLQHLAWGYFLQPLLLLLLACVFLLGQPLLSLFHAALATVAAPEFWVQARAGGWAGEPWALDWRETCQDLLATSRNVQHLLWLVLAAMGLLAWGWRRLIGWLAATLLVTALATWGAGAVLLAGLRWGLGRFAPEALADPAVHFGMSVTPHYWRADALGMVLWALGLLLLYALGTLLVRRWRQRFRATRWEPYLGDFVESWYAATLFDLWRLPLGLWEGRPERPGGPAAPDATHLRARAILAFGLEYLLPAAVLATLARLGRTLLELPVYPAQDTLALQALGAYTGSFLEIAGFGVLLAWWLLRALLLDCWPGLGPALDPFAWAGVRRRPLDEPSRARPLRWARRLLWPLAIILAALGIGPAGALALAFLAETLRLVWRHDEQCLSGWAGGYDLALDPAHWGRC